MQNVGAQVCQDSTPDGYTICIINADPMIYNQFLLKSLPFDPVKGLQPVSKLFDLIHMPLVVNSDLKVKNARRARSRYRRRRPARCPISRPARRWCSIWKP